jgi:uridine kinase
MRTKPIFIGIAGGTGAGKSTLCTLLQEKYPEQIGLIQLDDYFKPIGEQPKIGDILNFEHPDSLYFDKFFSDLKKLSKNNSVIINTKNEKLNPDYKNTNKRIPVEFKPKPIMLVEGYLILWNERVRNLLDISIWLDVDHEKRWKRRVHFKNDEYEQKVLIPMQRQFVEPTKQYVKHIIDVNNLLKEEVLEKVEKIINQNFSLLKD